MALAPGTRLGPYEILSPVGAGGMGEVYKAHDPRLGRDVAVKVLTACFSVDPDRLRRFEQEARAPSAKVDRVRDPDCAGAELDERARAEVRLGVSHAPPFRHAA